MRQVPKAIAQEMERLYFRGADDFNGLFGAVETQPHPWAKSPSGRAIFTLIHLRRGDPRFGTLAVVTGVHGIELGGVQQIFKTPSVFDGLGFRGHLLVVYAVNAHGAAWMDRADEDGADPNRRKDPVVDPRNDSALLGIKHLIMPDQPKLITRASIGQVASRLGGAREAQAVLSSGQSAIPGAPFYTGLMEGYTTNVFQGVLDRISDLASNRVVVVDLHTGLGPDGQQTVMCLNRQSEMTAVARSVFGEDIQFPYSGPAIPTAVTGSLMGYAGRHDGWLAINAEQGRIDPVSVYLALCRRAVANRAFDACLIDGYEWLTYCQELAEVFYSTDSSWQDGAKSNIRGLLEKVVVYLQE
jgi:hypothetical protein